MQRKEKEYAALKNDDSDSDSESNRLVDFLRKHEPGGELDEKDFIEVTDELGRTRLMKRQEAEHRDLVAAAYNSF